MFLTKPKPGMTPRDWHRQERDAGLLCCIPVALFGLFIAIHPARAAESAQVRMYGYCLKHDETSALAIHADDAKSFNAALSKLRSECEDWRLSPTLFEADKVLMLETYLTPRCSTTVYQTVIQSEKPFEAFPFEQRGTGCPRR